MRLTARRVAVVVAAAVVLSPLSRDPVSDSYPLSTYPMFATNRGPVHDLATAVEIDAGGVVHRLSPTLIAGTAEPVLASVTVSRAVRADRSEQLCAEILERLGPGRTVEVRTETVDVIEFIADDAEPLAVRAHARCGDD